MVAKVPRGMVSLEQVRTRAAVRQVDLEAALRLEGVQVWHRAGHAMVRRQDADRMMPTLQDLRKNRLAECRARREAYLPNPDHWPREVILNHVYFIGCLQFVKIGHGYNITQRLRDFQVANPFPLTVLATIPGGEPEERALHRRFRQHHHRGEWFYLREGLADLVEELKTRSPRIFPENEPDGPLSGLGSRENLPETGA